LSRLIKLDSGRRERDKLLRSIVVCINRFNESKDSIDVHKDLIAYIILALEELYKIINTSIEAWEKRDYWIKAERYKSEWQWSEIIAKKLSEALTKDDWHSIGQIIEELRIKLSYIKIPKYHHIDTPWNGAWQMLQDRIETIKQKQNK